MSGSRDDAVHDLSVRGGCLAKLPGAPLRQLLEQLHTANAAWQDAALIDTGTGQLLASVDFGPLVCADPYTAGRIAALNAFSDTYASGGVPVAALALIVVDTARPLAVAEQVLAGIAVATAEAGAIIAGGQTITGSECLAGLSVIGKPAGPVFRKNGGRPGDQLFLSKPLGTGLALWAHAIGAAADDAAAAAIELMLRSNAGASRAAHAAAAHAVTDITGFGLLGHLSEMLHDGLGATIELDRVPLLSSVRELPPSLRTTSAIGANTVYVRESIDLRTGRGEGELAPLFDAQTNGGLLIAASSDATELLEREGFTRIGALTAGAAIVVM